MDASLPEGAAAALDALAPPALVWFADLAVDVGTPIDGGDSPQGRRRLVPILGGTLQARDFRARVLPGGADVQRIVPGGTRTELDARYMLQSDDGALIYVHNQALRSAAPDITARLARGEPVDPAQVYFRCWPRLESSAPALAWVNERLFVGCGLREPARVLLRFYLLD
jgi:hypothetical protein